MSSGRHLTTYVVSTDARHCGSSVRIFAGGPISAIASTISTGTAAAAASRELGLREGAAAQAQEARRDPVAAIGAEHPAPALLVPVDGLHRGLEQRVVVQVPLAPDAAQVLEDLLAAGVLLRRDVAGLLQQRQVDVGLHVAAHAGVAVPVPDAAEVGRLLEDPQAGHARLAQPHAGEQPGHAAADDSDVDLLDQRLPSVGLGGVGVGGVVRELALDPDVLSQTVGAQALVALRQVLRVQCRGVDVGRHLWSSRSGLATALLTGGRCRSAAVPNSPRPADPSHGHPGPLFVTRRTGAPPAPVAGPGCP